MKKILCLALALLMIVSVAVACKKDGDGGAESTNETGTPEYSGTNPSTGANDPTETNDPITEDKESVLVACDEIVYTTADLRLRSSMSFDDDSNIQITVSVGTQLKRIAKGVYGDEQWSKVVYDNKEYYTSSKYLSDTKGGTETAPETSPEAEIAFTDCDETVYVIEENANYRSAPVKSDASIVKSLAKGTAVKRTGIAYDKENDPEGLGWSRVEIEGKTYYMRNSVLSTTAPAETPAATTAAAN